MTAPTTARCACAALVLTSAAASQGAPQCSSETGTLPPPAQQQSGQLLGTAVTAFGDEVIVGAPRTTVGGQVDQGAAFVYGRDVAGVWTEKEMLTGSTSDFGDAFGSALDMTDQVLVVGAPENLSFNEQGKAYIFEKTPTGWVETFAFSPNTPGELVAFGQAVAVDGNLAAVSGPFSDLGAQDGGAIWLFQRVGGVWTSLGTVTAAIPLASESLGFSLDLSGNRLAAGAVAGLGVGVGRALLFEPTGSTWTQTAELLPSVGTAGDWFGSAVSLGTGEMAVGACFWGTDGAVFLFQESAGTWSETQILQPSVPALANNLGVQVELSGDALIATDLFGTGYAALYGRDPSGWIEVDRLVPSGAQPGDGWGTDAAFSGPDVFLGAPLAGASASGAVATFYAAGSPQTYCSAKTNSQGCLPSVTTAGGAPGFSDPSFVVGAQSVVSQRAGLMFFGITGPFSQAFAGGTLCVLGPLGRTPIQWSFGNLMPDCSGVFGLDFNAWIQGGGAPWVLPGSQVWCQYWYRDPDHADGTGVGLTDAVTFGMCP